MAGNSCVIMQVNHGRDALSGGRKEGGTHMEAFSILDPRKPEQEISYMPGYFRDLNLDQLLQQIKEQAPVYDIEAFFYRMPEDADWERYRRQIYTDVKQPEVYACLERFSETMRRSGEYINHQAAVENPMQKNAWYASAVYNYCKAVCELQAELSRLPVASDGLRRFSAYLNNYVNQEDFAKCKTAAYQMQQEMDGFQLILVIENNRLTVTPGKAEGAYADFLGEPGTCSSPFAGDMTQSGLEEEIFAIYRKKYPALFDGILKFAKEFPDFEDAAIRRFEKEIQYYLAFYRFEEKWKERGFTFCVPDRNPARDMQAKGLYDLALACSNYLRDKPVVSNDFVYHPGEAFFVVNGPNQGGKTTFARSLGQLVYFSKMGLDVPAEQANIHDFGSLLTHFSVEESMETGRGKLMEELDRLAPMMEKEAEGAFVIINELFTTAAHYDGCIMGARVLQHFIGNHCRGIYVTHLKELGEAVEGVVTMTAMLDERDGTHRRTYQILRHAPLDMGYAEDIVEKYGLKYDSLRARLETEKEGWH